MSLINCKVELKLRWTNYVLSAAGNDNLNNIGNIIFTIKDTKWYIPVVTLSSRGNQKFSKLLSKGFKRSVYWNEYKTKSDDKNTTKQFKYFLQSNFLGVNRLYVVIINEKNFYDQAIHSDIKRYEEIRKLTTGIGEHYITGCLLDYDYIENHYRLIVFDLSTQKQLDADPKAILQIKFIGQLKKLNAYDNATDAENDDQSMFVLTIFKKIKEMRLKFSQGSVTVL